MRISSLVSKIPLTNRSGYRAPDKVNRRDKRLEAPGNILRILLARLISSFSKTINNAIPVEVSGSALGDLQFDSPLPERTN